MTVVIDGTSGVTFAAGTGALNYYEEGTWTPALSGTGSTFAYAANGQVGTYTRVGRQVTVQFRIQLNTTGNTLGAGALTITSLPFTSANVTSQSNYGTASFANLTTSLVQLPFTINPNVTTVSLFKLTAAGTTTTTQLVGTDLHATNGTVIGGTISYFV